MPLPRTRILLILAATTANAAVPLPPEQAEFFETKIRPVLASECQECHDAKKQKGGLRLDYRDGWKKGGDSGDAIIPGQPAKSLLLKSFRHEDPDLKMPLKRPKLSDAVIADFEKWIAMGAPDPRDAPAKSEAAVPWAQLLADRKSWWSLLPIQKPQPPAVKNTAWSQHPVDHFLLAKMEEHGLAPAADADPRTLIRRLTFALTGLPPTPEEVEEFVRELDGDKERGRQGDKEKNPLSLSPPPLVPLSSPQARKAIEHATDRLLQSPRFGERWARHWMDLVRYADTHGSEGDPEIPEAWRYRDYLIRAINADVPLNQIIREHIAGDLIPNPRWNRGEHFNESILGIAHLRFVEHGFQPVDTRDEQVKVTDSQIDVATKAFLGLTVSCARCHDHKFDAISQRDYYALAGIFESSRPAMVTIDEPALLETNRAELSALKGKIREALFQDWKNEPAKIAARLFAEFIPNPNISFVSREIEGIQRSLFTIDHMARDRLAKADTAQPLSTAPRPIARWSFDGDARDSIGGLKGELLGGAEIRHGRLVLDGKDAHFRSAPLARDLREKTLEAWVSLATLEQGGGGVVTVESAKGAVFDALVFGEKSPRHWVAGSNNFRRSQALDAAAENAKPGDLIHIAASYHADGTIAFFRNGRPYGQPWKPKDESPVVFAAKDAHVLLGRRHTGGGRAFLSGEIDEARIYDRGLDDAEIRASFQAGQKALAPDAAALAKALTPAERAQKETLERNLRDAEERRRKLSDGASDKPLLDARADAERNSANPLHVWAKLKGMQGDAMAAAWEKMQRAANADAKRPDAKRAWDLTKAGGDFAECYRYGTGVAEQPAPVGDFSIAAEGDAVLGGLHPAGVTTHSLTTKHNGVLTTKPFRVETDFISIRAWGGGGAQARLIVDGYPLGTNPIFPRAQLVKDEPAWLTLDTKYRKGSMAYLEIATTADQTRREKSPKERSWFGISEIICHDGPGPAESSRTLAPLLAGPAPRDSRELSQRYETAIAAALGAWRANALSEPQRALLDSLIRRRLLPVSLGSLENAKPLIAEFRRLEAAVPSARHAPGVLEATGEDSALLERGEHTKPGAKVQRAFLEVFGAQPFATKMSGRLELANAITDSKNPLTARVMANRVWLQLFGRGLVATPDNFGRMGEKPTHPELLEYLATRFAEDGWSLKKMIRFLVTTRAYRLASDADATARERDPGNDWLSHFRVRRIEAEAIRDSLLALSGKLDETMSGPGVSAGAPRRSVYLIIRRTSLNPFLETFDAPKPFTTTGRRDATNVPAQSLTLLNDPFVIECAAAWAKRIFADTTDTDARIGRMFIAAFARLPGEAELDASHRYLSELATDAPDDERNELNALRDFAQSLFNAKEFIFLR